MASSDQITDAEKGNALLDRTEYPVETVPKTIALVERDAAVDVEEVDPKNKYLAWAYRLEHMLGFEARGIHRVSEEEQTKKTTLGFLRIVMMWFSINAAAQNITLGSIGSSVFGLGFVDATLCSVFGAIAGTIPVAFTAGWGPLSGNRTMVRLSCLCNRLGSHTSTGLRSIYHGLVACKALCYPESCYPDWILYDRCCSGWSNSFCSVK